MQRIPVSYARSKDVARTVKPLPMREGEDGQFTSEKAAGNEHRVHLQRAIRRPCVGK